MQVFERVRDADLHFPAVSVRVSVVSKTGCESECRECGECESACGESG